MASRKTKFTWPLPVYVARFKGGETCRLSFGTPQGKPIDFDRGRRYACHVIGLERGWATRPVLPYYGPYTSAHYYRKYTPDLSWLTRNFPPAADIEYGEVEWDGEVFIDPFFTGETPAAAKPPKASALDRLIASLGKLSPAELVRLSAEVEQRIEVY